MKTVYRRNLPHILPPGATIFVTFRLAGSLPQNAIERLRQERQQLEATLTTDAALHAEEVKEAHYRLRRLYFGKFDALLDRSVTGPLWLKTPEVADLVVRQIQRLSEQGVLMHSFCVMPNHVHAVLQLLPETTSSFASLMQQVKGASAREANRLLRRQGAFWQHESYDHVVRDAAELQRINQYVVQNPVKAGLVKVWDEWPYSSW